MSQLKSYKLVIGNHGRCEPRGAKNPQPVVYRPGDVMELTSAEAARLGDRVVLVDDSPAASVSGRSEKSTAEPAEGDEDPEPYGLGDLSWSEAAELIASLDTAAEVSAAAVEEKSGKARKGVLKAADDRLAELG